MRLTVTGTVYGGAAVPYAWQREVSTDEQSFVRHGTASEELRQLERGWVERAVWLVLECRRADRDRNPTPEEAAADAEAVLELWVGGLPILEVYPGEVCPGFSPIAPLESLQLRCRSGSCRYVLTLFPR